MLFTQSTRKSCRRRRIRCWGLDGCLPQSSANTKSGGREGRVSTTYQLLIKPLIGGVHPVLGKEFEGTLLAGLGKPASQLRITCKGKDVLGQRLVGSRRRQQAGSAVHYDFTHAADTCGH